MEKSFTQNSELSNALKECKGSIVSVILFSNLVNLFMLVGSVYMLEIYDRVLPSRSIPTLIALSFLAFIFFVAQGFFDFIRARILTRIANHLDEKFDVRILIIFFEQQQSSSSMDNYKRSQKHIETIRNFISGGGLTAFIDLPWVPIFLAILFLLHWLLGVTAFLGALVLSALAIWLEHRARRILSDLGTDLTRKASFYEAIQGNATAITSMGMAANITRIVQNLQLSIRKTQTSLADISSSVGVSAKIVRISLQSGILGLGALLVIWGEATTGIIIASSILLGRALAPIEAAISHWRNFMRARDSWQKLSFCLQTFPIPPKKMRLPRASQILSVENLYCIDRERQKIFLSGISFALAAGDAVCIIGPSAAGKTTLTRVLANCEPPTRGVVKLDGAPLVQWDREDLGQNIGYLPQEINFFPGTVAQNISRFSHDMPVDSIISAAKSAGAHELILRLKHGYETQIGNEDFLLSSGQRQRLALARAIFNDPFLVILDEPNSHLDAEGELALHMAIKKVKQRSGIVVCTSHRPNLLHAFNKVMLLKEGKMVAFGLKDEVLQKYLAGPTINSREVS